MLFIWTWLFCIFIVYFVGKFHSIINTFFAPSIVRTNKNIFNKNLRSVWKPTSCAYRYVYNFTLDITNFTRIINNTSRNQTIESLWRREWGRALTCFYRMRFISCDTPIYTCTNLFLLYIRFLLWMCIIISKNFYLWINHVC